MVLPALLMYFGTKLTQTALDSSERQEQEVVYCRPPPTAPPADSQIGPSKYFSGIVKDGYFYHTDKILNLKNIIILNICICPLSQSADKAYSGKINIMSEKGSILKQEYNERVRWITLPGEGLGVSNATIKVKVKSAQAVALQYTVVYKERDALV